MPLLFRSWDASRSDVARAPRLHCTIVNDRKMQARRPRYKSATGFQFRVQPEMQDAERSSAASEGDVCRPGGEAYFPRMSFKALSTSWECASLPVALGQCMRTLPSGPMRKVSRLMPQYWRPYMLFSIQTPYFSATA